MSAPFVPDAYWAHVPLWMFFVLAGLAILAASPSTIQWVRGKDDRFQSKEKAFVDQQERQNARWDALIDSYQKSEAAARVSLEAERTARDADRKAWDIERETIHENRLEGWDRARGAEQLAHDFRHQCNNYAQRHNSMMEQMIQMQCSQDFAGYMQKALARYVPFDMAAPVPDLQQIDRKPPPDTRAGS